MTEIITEDTEWGVVVWVDATNGKERTFSSFSREHAQMRGLAFKAIDNRCEGTCEILRDTIPSEIEDMGKAAIASYLFAVHAEGYEGTAARLGVSVGTVKQYLSDFRHGRR